MSEIDYSARPRSDFIYTKNSARPGSDYIYTKIAARPGSDFLYTKNSGGRGILAEISRKSLKKLGGRYDKKYRFSKEEFEFGWPDVRYTNFKMRGTL